MWAQISLVVLTLGTRFSFVTLVVGRSFLPTGACTTNLDAGHFDVRRTLQTRSMTSRTSRSSRSRPANLRFQITITSIGAQAKAANQSTFACTWLAVNQIIVNDSSPTTMTATIAAYQKVIVWDPFFSPRELSTLRDRILEVAGVERWLK